MTIRELIDRVNHSEFEWTMGLDKQIYVCWPGGGEEGEMVKVSRADLPQLTWPQVRQFVLDGRNVSGWSRIVGYFSQVNNWNESKKGELKDRQGGEYAVA